jgi:MoaA/NifB/PqqE/SkfB family radical SAM enzyme
MKLIQIEPTTRCNFTCGFCIGRHMEQRDLAFEVFEKVLELNPDLEHVEIQGEGEPLMHPRFFDMVERCREKGILVSTITNGSYFTAENVDKILSGGIVKVAVSVESPDPITFREIRGGKFEKVIRGIELLMKTRASRGVTRPIVGFSVSVLRRTLDAMPAILELYHRLGLDGGISIQFLNKMPDYVSIYDAAMNAQMPDDESVAAHRKSLSMNKDYGAILSARVKGPRGFYDELIWGWSPRTRTCPWLERGGYVTSAGDVAACYFMAKNPGSAFGNVATYDAAKIAAQRDELRREIARGAVPPPCKGCSVIEAIGAATGHGVGSTRRRLDLV